MRASMRSTYASSAPTITARDRAQRRPAVSGIRTTCPAPDRTRSASARVSRFRTSTLRTSVRRIRARQAIDGLVRALLGVLTRGATVTATLTSMLILVVGLGLGLGACAGELE